MPNTSQWREGVKVKGATNLVRGTVIATFVNGQYPNNSTGQHSAVYDSQDAHGIWVWDQWKGHAVSKRYIRFRASDYTGSLSNNGNAYSVVE